MNDCLTRIKYGKTLYGRAGVHAGVLEDPWCPTCLKEDNLEIEDSTLHSLYSCRHAYRTVLSLSDYCFLAIPTGTEFILGVTTSKINQAIDKQTGCLMTSLINNYAAHIITTKIRANKSLVAVVIIKEIISQLNNILLLTPQCTASKVLNNPLFSHFTTFTRSRFTDFHTSREDGPIDQNHTIPLQHLHQGPVAHRGGPILPADG